MKFKSPTNKEIHINLTSGHSASVSGEWTELHPMFHREAIINGCISNNMSEEAINAKSSDGSETHVIDRGIKIREALESMIETGKESDFTSAGQPKIVALRDLVGFGISREEMMVAWKTIVDDSNEDDEANDE